MQQWQPPQPPQPQQTPQQKQEVHRIYRKTTIGCIATVVWVGLVLSLCPDVLHWQVSSMVVKLICIAVFWGIALWSISDFLPDVWRFLTGQVKQPTTHGSAHVGTRDDAAPFRRPRG